MSTILEDVIRKLEYVALTKKQIRSALKEKDVDVPEDASFLSYVDYVGQIPDKKHTDLGTMIVSVPANETNADYIKSLSGCVTGEDGNLATNRGYGTIQRLGDVALADKEQSFNWFGGITIGNSDVIGRACRGHNYTGAVPSELRPYVTTAIDKLLKRSATSLDEWRHLLIAYENSQLTLAFLMDYFECDCDSRYRDPYKRYNFAYARLGRCWLVHFKPDNTTTPTINNYTNVVGASGYAIQLEAIVFCNTPLYSGSEQIWPDDPDATFPYLKGCDML